MKEVEMIKHISSLITGAGAYAISRSTQNSGHGEDLRRSEFKCHLGVTGGYQWIFSQSENGARIARHLISTLVETLYNTLRSGKGEFHKVQ
jgi:hypothetical protein